MTLSFDTLVTVGQPSWSSQVWEIYECVTGKQRPELFASTREPSKAPRNDHPLM